MDAHNIYIEAGTRKVLHTAGKYCDRDIAIIASGDSYDKGHSDGYDDGYDDGYSDGIQEGRANGYQEGYDEGIVEGYADGARDGRDEGYELGWSDGNNEGHQEAYNAFWDAFQANGNRRAYNWAFYGTSWVDACFNPKYDIIIEGAATNAFAQTGITDTKVAVDISNCSNTTGLFSNSVAIKTIRKLKVSENTPMAGDMFSWTTELTNITIEGTIGKSIAFPNSPKLTTASVDSIINALKDLTGQTAQTLTFYSTVKNNLTDAQKASISAKNWTLG